MKQFKQILVGALLVTGLFVSYNSFGSASNYSSLIQQGDKKSKSSSKSSSKSNSDKKEKKSGSRTRTYTPPKKDK